MTDQDSRTDAELLAATPEDPDSFAAFYRRHVQMILALVARRAQPSEVWDLVAEVFVTALVHRRRYDPARGPGGAWLTGIAHHKLADAARRGAVEARMCRRLGVHLSERAPDDVALERAGSGELLSVLSDEQRRAVRARVLDDKSYEQIAPGAGDLGAGGAKARQPRAERAAIPLSGGTVNRDFIDELEQELRAASQRRVRLTAARLPRPSAGTAVSGLRAIPGVVAVLVVIAVAAVALLGIQHRPAGHSAVTPAVSGREQLIGILGVLRRAQTPADLHSPVITRFLSGQASGADVPLIRRAATTPWGQGVFVIPIKPPASQRHTGERIDLEVGGGGGCCAPAAVIRAGHEMLTEGAGRSFAGGSTQTRLILLVPDGVAKVQFVLPRQPSRNSPGSPIYPKPLRVLVPVHSNVAAVQVKRECCAGGVPMIWYGPGGHVIKRIGNPGAANRVLAPPKPGPQTAQSRAAQRDPSTPNRVWVTPAAGNQHAKYAVHFRLLLNDASYRFEMSGTSCPQITFAGGGGGGYSDLRGRILSYDLDAVTGQTWCPGTYHVTVSVMDLGRYGNLKHPALPFGAATFIVRR